MFDFLFLAFGFSVLLFSFYSLYAVNKNERALIKRLVEAELMEAELGIAVTMWKLGFDCKEIWRTRGGGL